jgi:hypothetical protein
MILTGERRSIVADQPELDSKAAISMYHSVYIYVNGRKELL